MPSAGRGLGPGARRLLSLPVSREIPRAFPRALPDRCRVRPAGAGAGGDGRERRRFTAGRGGDARRYRAGHRSPRLPRAVRGANGRVRDLLRAGDRLLDSDGLLSARSPRGDDDLRKLLGRALPPFAAQGAGGLMVVRRSGAPPPVLHVKPVGVQRADYPLSPTATPVPALHLATGVDVDPAVVATRKDFFHLRRRLSSTFSRHRRRTRQFRRTSPRLGKRRNPQSY